MTHEEFIKQVQHQEHLASECEDRIKLLKREYAKNAPLQVGDVVTDAKTNEECKVVGVGFGSYLSTYDFGVTSVLRKKKADGTYSCMKCNPYNGVIKDGVKYPFVNHTTFMGTVMRDGEVVKNEE